MKIIIGKLKKKLIVNYLISVNNFKIIKSEISSSFSILKLFIKINVFLKNKDSIIYMDVS